MILATSNAGVAGAFDNVLPRDCDVADMSRFSEGGTVAAAGIVARKGLSDRYPRKNQIFRQMPNSFPRPPSLVRITQGGCSDAAKWVTDREDVLNWLRPLNLRLGKGRRGARAADSARVAA
jgi:hypothetical protein